MLSLTKRKSISFFPENICGSRIGNYPIKRTTSFILCKIFTTFNKITSFKISDQITRWQTEISNFKVACFRAVAVNTIKTNLFVSLRFHFTWIHSFRFIFICFYRFAFIRNSNMVFSEALKIRGAWVYSTQYTVYTNRKQPMIRLKNFSFVFRARFIIIIIIGAKGGWMRRGCSLAFVLLNFIANCCQQF